jgi:hypothetical protein
VSECVGIRKISSDFLECSQHPSIEITKGESGRIIARARAAIAALLDGKEVYRHLLFVCSVRRAVQAEKTQTLIRR